MKSVCSILFSFLFAISSHISYAQTPGAAQSISFGNQPSLKEIEDDRIAKCKTTAEINTEGIADVTVKAATYKRVYNECYLSSIGGSNAQACSAAI
jgi:hypothetical protein